MKKKFVLLAFVGLAIYYILSRLKICCRPTKIVLPQVNMPEGKGLEDQVCIKTPWSMTGPVWKYGDSSSGGLTLRVGYGGDPKFPEHQDYVEPTISNVFGLKDIGAIEDGEVTLLVIDDFGIHEIPYIDEVTGEKLTAKASHGNTVTSHIRCLLQDAGFETNGDLHHHVAGIKRMVYRHSSGRMINLDLFDLNLIALGDPKLKIFTTKNLAQYLNRGLSGDYLLAQKSLIINMSFVLFPCKYAMIYHVRKVAAEAAGRSYNYQDLVNEIVLENPLIPPETIRRDMTHIDPSDALLTWLRQTKANFTASGSGSFYAIAASGNYGFDFSFYPAASDFAISVGGFTWEPAPANLMNKTKDDWTNSADLLSPVAWFTIPTPQLKKFCDAGGGTCALEQSYFQNMPPEFTQLGYRGTSFASPSVAAYLAMKVRPGQPQFPVGSGSGLGFVFSDGKPVVKTQDAFENPSPVDKARVFRGDSSGKI